MEIGVSLSCIASRASNTVCMVVGVMILEGGTMWGGATTPSSPILLESCTGVEGGGGRDTTDLIEPLDSMPS